MKRRYRLRASAALAAISTVLAVGTISVQAAGTCQRIVRRVIQRAAPHRPSKATLASWAEWNKAHPNWHPPKRPNPGVSPKEVAEKVDFACEVPVLDQTETATFTPGPGFTPEFPLTSVTINTGPPPSPPAVSLVNVPALPPPEGGIPDVPEPPSVIYMVTAGAMLFAARRWHMRKEA
jgi:hypothetical protein